MEHIQADECSTSGKRVCVPDGNTPHKPKQKKTKNTPLQRPIRKHLFGDPTFSPKVRNNLTLHEFELSLLYTLIILYNRYNMYIF